jgi:Zn-dependent M16 (insulinase) family peptidase
MCVGFVPGRYYHPSNSLVFFYGDDPEDKRLEIADNYLGGFDAQPATGGVALQARTRPSRAFRAC